MNSIADFGQQAAGNMNGMNGGFQVNYKTFIWNE